jgi:hypothetical protein
MGELEDQFFATVFLASGLLFVACLFGSAAVMAALIESVATGNIANETYYFNRRVSDALLNLFAMKMAAVFMFTTCTIGLRTAIFPRWLAFLGYASAAVLLFSVSYFAAIVLIFPAYTTKFSESACVTLTAVRAVSSSTGSGCALPMFTGTTAPVSRLTESP